MVEAITEAQATNDTEALRVRVREIIRDEMQIANMPDGIANAMLALFEGAINVEGMIAMGMQGMLKP